MSTKKATGRGAVVRELVTVVSGIFPGFVDRGINYWRVTGIDRNKDGDDDDVVVSRRAVVVIVS